MSSADANGGLTLSKREVKLLNAAMACAEGGPLKVDYSQLKDEMSLSSAKVASNAWCALRKKIVAAEGGAPPTTPKTPRKRKAAPAAPETPSKRAAVKTEPADEDEEDSEDDAGPVAGGRGPSPPTV